MTDKPTSKPLTRDEILALDPTKYAVAISYGEPGTDNYNILGTTYGMGDQLSEAFSEVEYERWLGDRHIKVVVIKRTSIEILEVE